MAAPRDVPIREETIRLGQLLKLAGLADSGAQARELVQDGATFPSPSPGA
jgi:ribosome-associated protein